MINAEQIEEILKRELPGASVGVIDLTGTSDHFEARVEWEEFRGKGLIQQHQKINEALKAQLDDGSIHALKIKTFVPEG